MTGKRVVFLLQGKEQIYLQTFDAQEVLKGSLQNVKLILDLLCHKRDSHITTVVDGSGFKKMFKTILERKMLEDIIFTRVLQ